ncbi:ABC transporter ATP-binding protein [Rhodoferax sp. 4810]|nr:ABC transporter ATP-binding protein [Rhodoferax jenense]
MSEPVLTLSNITKRFGDLVANDNISLELQHGEVLALLGENGAGKSTLVSILFGHYTADEGEIRVHGQVLPPGDPKAALAAGIGMVHQHFTLADNLSVLDNIMMGSEPLWQPFSRHAQAIDKLKAVALEFGLTVDPKAKVGNLSVGERQRVEILKALYRGARILILDEPTAVLTPQESESLFEVLAQMVAQGLAIIFISHKLGEVLRVSNRVAVLRGGKLVAEALAKGCTQAQLAQWMVGHAVDAPVRRPARSVGQAVCTVHNVSTEAARERLQDVSLTLRAGEIVAIAGVSGNGQVALAELLCGTRAATSGTVTFLGQPLPKHPAELVALGVARIPEDRHAVGVVGDLPVWENAVSERLRSPAFSRWGWVRRTQARAYAKQVMEAFDVRGGGPLVAARALSGGNMQKLILGRALMKPAQGTTDSIADNKTAAPRLIIAHQPTWGLDIGAVAYVQSQLIAARDAGAAVLLISDDLDEVLTLGDRVAVMHAGQLTEARPALDWSREAIGLAMAGVSANHRHGASLAAA